MITYNGYQFKTGLAARWAVFFGALGIKYLYEPEEYVFEDISYTPTFYLPQYDYVIDIKEEDLTEEDWENAFLFALYEDKIVYMFIGDVWLPGEPNSYYSQLSQPPGLFSHLKDEEFPGPSTEEIEAPAIVKVILQKLDDCGVQIAIRHKHLELSSRHYLYHDDIAHGIKAHLRRLRDQYECISDLAPLIAQNVEEIVETLTPREGREIEFVNQRDQQGFFWAECSACGDLSLVFSLKEEDREARKHHDCKYPHQGFYIFNTPRLLTAYAAARQVDFS